MQRKNLNLFLSLFLILVFVLTACGAFSPAPTSTPVPPTATKTAVPTNTPKPSRTPYPSITPDISATEERAAREAETQKYFDLGYLTTTEGELMELNPFRKEWAQLNWYRWWTYEISASDFYLSGHFRWESAYRNADISGCGFAFGIQENNDNYAVFLDRSKVLFVDADHSVGYFVPVGPTRGTGKVDIEGSIEDAAEADFTLIVKDAYAYVLVNGEVVGEYTLSQSRPRQGKLGLTLLSGTNKNYGTRCEMTDLHAWISSGN